MLYPFLVLLAVTITANHFIMDAVGVVIVIGSAAPPLVALYYRRICGGTWAGTTAHSEPPPAVAHARLPAPNRLGA